MKVHYIIPYSLEKNLGRAYNEAMQLVPEQDSVCFTDGDSMYTRPDFGHVIHQYATANPNAVLTCWISAIHELAQEQNAKCGPDVKTCLEVAHSMKLDIGVTRVTGTVSGTLLVVPKHIWRVVPFTEKNRYRPDESNMLGVDNAFTNDVRKAGFQVLRMESVLLYHQYRLLSGGKDKSHLL